jgi:GTPase SAR1 family protein
LASRIEAVAFFECSSKENINVESIFKAAVKTNLESKDQSWLSLLSCNLLTKPVTSCIKNNFGRK